MILLIKPRKDCFGTNVIPEGDIIRIIKDSFDLTPNGIIEYCDLKKTIFSKTTNYGHFGREARKIRSEELSRKAEERSAQYSNSTANRIFAMTPGQPIIIGHHSEKKARRLHEKAWQDIGKSIEEDKKSKYYKDRADSVENHQEVDSKVESFFEKYI